MGLKLQDELKKRDQVIEEQNVAIDILGDDLQTEREQNADLG